MAAVDRIMVGGTSVPLPVAQPQASKPLTFAQEKRLFEASVAKQETAVAEDFKTTTPFIDNAEDGQPGKFVPSDADNAQKRQDLDAFELLKDVFREYNLEELVPVIEGYMRNDVGPEQARILLKQEQAYKDRFAGNLKRAAKGLNVLIEDVYL